MAEIDGVDREYFLSKSPGKTYISKTFGKGEVLRYHDRVFDNELAPVFEREAGEVVLKIRHSGRVQVRATVFDSNRAIKTLLVQKYTSQGPDENYRFTFRGAELNALIDFLANIPLVPLEGEAKIHLTDSDLRQIKLTNLQANAIISKNPELFLQLVQSPELTRDLVAVGYRRRQLETFEAMLPDDTLREADWQRFFEANKWIFGYGLSYQFGTSLNDRKLEQIVSGSDLSGAGKRTDALMKTRGRISSLCFVEIKKPKTPLVTALRYRPGVWSASTELVGGVAQSQSTVHSAIERLSRKLMPTDDDENPTGEVLYNIEPRSCLVIGNLGDLHTEAGLLNEARFRSFEMYRRNTWRPEIITFDELLERARFIVEHAEELPDEPEVDDIPF